jgi:hypothetical protein
MAHQIDNAVTVLQGEIDKIVGQRIREYSYSKEFVVASAHTVQYFADKAAETTMRADPGTRELHHHQLWDYTTQMTPEWTTEFNRLMLQKLAYIMCFRVTTPTTFYISATDVILYFRDNLTGHAHYSVACYYVPMLQPKPQ